jgi:hypothetical protein
MSYGLDMPLVERQQLHSIEVWNVTTNPEPGTRAGRLFSLLVQASAIKSLAYLANHGLFSLDCLCYEQARVPDKCLQVYLPLQHTGVAILTLRSHVQSNSRHGH